MGNFLEAEVDGQVEIFVFDRQRHVAALIGLAFTKCKVLAVDLDLWVLSSGHHLDLKIRMFQANFAVLIKLDDCQWRVLLRAHFKSLLVSL